MSVIRTPTDAEVEGAAATLYAEDRESLGYVTTHTRVTALNPEAVAAFEQLIRAVVPSLGMRRYELVTLAAAGALGSTSCRAHHGVKALGYIEADELERIARDYRAAGLAPDEVAMMAFAERLSGDSASMTKEDAAELQRHGFSDREIVDIAFAAAARNFYSRSLHALGVEPDIPPTLPSSLRDALLEGMRTQERDGARR
ncbi:carboxymuconolactone decarboxylase family protein [Microbacterium invictum]|uniref:Carboxymuconolactone decarboxylase family protein n=1 Tax=Microbacterium invictum TaxID=515415 RepID=A0ABZ0VI29_9MICO|nr:carboxymuconolactone decarboxylase family protein [Microbacterium invictum]WQB71850.1 carboxymuconolactone decarboxylase family protein [Microbacterium invictum]